MTEPAGISNAGRPKQLWGRFFQDWPAAKPPFEAHGQNGTRKAARQTLARSRRCVSPAALGSDASNPVTSGRRTLDGLSPARLGQLVLPGRLRGNNPTPARSEQPNPRNGC